MACASSAELTLGAFDLVMLELNRRGFVSTAARRNFGDRAAMASPGQVALIRKLWAEYTDGKGDDASLGKWLSRIFKVSALRFLPDHQAPKAIGALRGMVARRAASEAA